ncbi:MAG: hypothetical protein EOP06_11020 [Proteobacteria bacterium]|nr:MAG: hypothetical protein EOP06_11020 [Pseudomonadota bacterium]
MGKSSAKPDVFEKTVKWLIDNQEKFKGDSGAHLIKELGIAKTAFETGEISDEQAELFGKTIVSLMLIAAPFSKSPRIIAAALVLQSLNATEWAGPAAGKILKMSFEKGPVAVAGAKSANAWFKEKYSEASTAVAEAIGNRRQLIAAAEKSEALSIEDKNKLTGS